MNIDRSLTSQGLLAAANRAIELAADRVRRLDRRWEPFRGAPVFTVNGRYESRGWTEWTQGFQFGAAILAFDGTDQTDLLELGRRRTIERMTPHLTHTGVHDHGFNNISTYGNLRRLMREGRIPHDEWQLRLYEMAIKVSGAVQAMRWTPVTENVFDDSRSGDRSNAGFIYSFNGPHSLFIDTMRTLRAPALAHQLGHVLMGEDDRPIDLLHRVVQHGLTTARFLIFDGSTSHTYDVRGRTAHEGLFNTNDGRFRARSAQQGYSPFSTWTRGLAWAMLGFGEQLEFLSAIDAKGFESSIRGITLEETMRRFETIAIATNDHYINDCAASDGVAYWDDGAPGLAKLGDWRSRPGDPFNDCEPVDASASAIAAQGLLRLGRHLGDSETGRMYTAAGLSVARTLFSEPYLSTKPGHEGLLLHSVYHRPNGWDHVPAGRRVPCGESSMWGDYHLIELALMIQRAASAKPYYQFFDAAAQ